MYHKGDPSDSPPDEYSAHQTVRPRQHTMKPEAVIKPNNERLLRVQQHRFHETIYVVEIA